MNHKTKGIVLRTVKYGETSMIASILTELFGVQSYMIKGARSAGKKNNLSVMLQPAALLELEVYHNESKNLQRIKECSWSFLYQDILSDVVKNCIASFMIELLSKTIKQPEAHPELFYFCEDAFVSLDGCSLSEAANFPLFFSLQLPQFFGFTIQNNCTKEAEDYPIYLDLKEGTFNYTQPEHLQFIGGKNALITAELLKVMHPSELSQVKLNKHIRRELLEKYQLFYALHFSDFGTMKTLKILEEVLS